MRIIADENMPGLAPFERLGVVERVDGRRLTRRQLNDADVLLVRSVTRVDRALLEGSPVKFVGSATIGTDHVDQDALADLGIAFAHAPGCNARAVAEYVLQALLLASQRQGKALRESRVGLVGLGNVGGLVANWLQALGVEVVASDPPLQRRGVPAPAPLMDLDAVLEADLISLHVPLTRAGEGSDATEHLLGPARLAALRPGQTLLSTCRGPVIDNVALRKCLADGKGPLVLLDVWEGEPRPDPVLLEQVWRGSPHVAGYSLEGKLRGSAMLYQAWCDRHRDAPPAPVSEADGGVIEANIESEANLLMLLRHAYRLEEDDTRLRRALGESDPGRAFDALRKHYPLRHELHHWRHQGRVAAAFRPLVNRLFAPAVADSTSAAPAPGRP